MQLLRLLAPFSLLPSLAAIAQTAPDSDLTVPPGHIRIPVLVTDKQGKPVPGLHVDDFRVLDNGKPAAIDTFLTVSTAMTRQDSVGSAFWTTAMQSVLISFRYCFSLPLGILSACHERAPPVGLHGSTVLDLAPFWSEIGAASLLPACNSHSLWNLD